MKMEMKNKFLTLQDLDEEPSQLLELEEEIKSKKLSSVVPDVDEASDSYEVSSRAGAPQPCPGARGRGRGASRRSCESPGGRYQVGGSRGGASQPSQKGGCGGYQGAPLQQAFNRSTATTGRTTDRTLRSKFPNLSKELQDGIYVHYDLENPATFMKKKGRHRIPSRRTWTYPFRRSQITIHSDASGKKNSLFFGGGMVGRFSGGNVIPESVGYGCFKYDIQFALEDEVPSNYKEVVLEDGVPSNYMELFVVKKILEEHDVDEHPDVLIRCDNLPVVAILFQLQYGVDFDEILKNCQIMYVEEMVTLMIEIQELIFGKYFGGNKCIMFQWVVREGNYSVNRASRIGRDLNRQQWCFPKRIRDWTFGLLLWRENPKGVGICMFKAEKEHLIKESLPSVVRIWSLAADKSGISGGSAAEQPNAHKNGSFSACHVPEDVDSRSIFVNNINFAATKNRLSRLFRKFGKVLKVITSGLSKGSAYIEFTSKEAADLALSLDGTSFMTRTLKVVKKSSASLKVSPAIPRGPSPRAHAAAFGPRLPVETGAPSLQWKPKHSDVLIPATVVLRSVFTLDEMRSDVNLKAEVKSDVEDQCVKFGPVELVEVCEYHPQGVVLVTFKDTKDAHMCIAQMNGRWNAGRVVRASIDDGPATVVLQFMFTPAEMRSDVNLKDEVKSDVEEACVELGPVELVEVCENHPQGVVLVRFKDTKDAHKCIAQMNGKWYTSSMQVYASIDDGSVNHAAIRDLEYDEARLA